MNEKQADDMLATLRRIELILMNIANNTNSLGTPGTPRTYYGTTTWLDKPGSGGVSKSPT
jgi:hypothetical protein